MVYFGGEDKAVTFTLRINARNDIHMPAEVLRALNIGEHRILKAEVKDNAIVLIPVDLEPLYSKSELEGLDQLHTDEKKKKWLRLDSDKDIDGLLK